MSGLWTPTFRDLSPERPDFGAEATPIGLGETPAHLPQLSRQIIADSRSAGQSGSMICAIRAREHATDLPTNVVEEEEYVSAMDSIIKRDFFPDVGTLKEHNDLLDAGHGMIDEHGRLIVFKQQAKDENGSETSASIHALAQSNMGDTDTPSSNSSSSSTTTSNNKKDPTRHTLNKYQANFTSEDNASFAVLLEKNKQLHRQRYWWIEDSITKHEQQRLAINDDPNRAKAIGLLDHYGKAVAQSSVFYIPEAKNVGKTEAVRKFGPKEIVYKNTRFEKPTGTVISGGVPGLTPQVRSGKTGGANDAASRSGTPAVRGYKFVASPSPSPGQHGESPFMTWGEVVGTPVHIAVEDSDATDKFKIPALPSRDRVMMKLADRAAKRLNEQRAIDKGRKRRMRTPVGDRAITPAAAQLAKRIKKQSSQSSMFGGGLQSSYAPTPQQAARQASMRRHTGSRSSSARRPSSNRLRRPSSMVSSSGRVPSTGLPPPSPFKAPSSSSLTDGLL